MHPLTYESGNRRAEIADGFVVFLRMTGRVRRSKRAFWWVACEDMRKARAMALAWVKRGKMSRAAYVGG